MSKREDKCEIKFSICRVQGMALVNCTGAELVYEQIKGYKGLWCQKYILRLFFFLIQCEYIFVIAMMLY